MDLLALNAQPTPAPATGNTSPTSGVKEEQPVTGQPVAASVPVDPSPITHHPSPALPVLPPLPALPPLPPLPPISPATPSTQPADQATEPVIGAVPTEVEDLLNKDILELMGAKGLKDEDKKRLYDTMLATIQRRVANRIADALTDEQFTEWKALDQDAKQTYLDEKEIDAAQIYLEETLFYKAEMVELAKAAAQQPAPATVAAAA